MPGPRFTPHEDKAIMEVYDNHNGRTMKEMRHPIWMKAYILTDGLPPDRSAAAYQRRYRRLVINGHVPVVDDAPDADTEEVAKKRNIIVIDDDDDDGQPKKLARSDVPAALRVIHELHGVKAKVDMLTAQLAQSKAELVKYDSACSVATEFSKVTECDICLEPVNSDVVVFACSHACCNTCFKKFTNQNCHLCRRQIRDPTIIH